MAETLEEFATLIFCPIANYIAEKKKFKEQHPRAHIIDEFKSIQQVMEQKQGIAIPGRQQATFYICHVIFYTELVIKQSIQ
jgi:hypothetical protein